MHEYLQDLTDSGFDLLGISESQGNLPNYLHRRTGLVFVLIPSGVFQMGSEDDESDPDEKPVRAVRLTRPFLISRAPCSQLAWRRGAAALDLHGEIGQLARSAEFPVFGERDDMPVYHVSWDASAAWCRHNRLELPTEAQWEYACRAGSQSRFWFGDIGLRDWASLDGWMWYSEHNDLEAPRLSQLAANPWGLADLHGTIWEWCRDYYDPSFYARGVEEDPCNLSTSPKRVHRGGSWDVPAVCCRASARYRDAGDYCHGTIGFRPSFTL